MVLNIVDGVPLGVDLIHARCPMPISGVQMGGVQAAKNVQHTTND